MSTEATDVQKAEAVATDAESVLQQPTVAEAEQAARDVEGLVPVATEVVKETKAGYKTTEFYLTILGSLLTAVGAIPTPHDAKGFIVAGLVALYAVSRGLAKNSVPNITPSAE
jgi:hypothetical protein